MKVYLIWAINLPEETDTTDRDRYVEQFPCAAKYEPFYLFSAEKSEVSKLTCDVVDLSGGLVVETEGEKSSPDDLTQEEFLSLCDSMVTSEYTGKCIVLSVQQGKILHQERYSENL